MAVMKKWPTARTNTQGVTPATLQECRYWQFRIQCCYQRIVWLRGRGDFPPGILEAQNEMTTCLSKMEDARLRCRRQDIESRWARRFFDREYRAQPKPKPTRWQPAPMGYDQYHDRNRKLVDTP